MTDDDMADAWFAGKLPGFDEELKEVREIGKQVALFARLRYIAAENGWKTGWAAHFYKSLHGAWPDREWDKVPPIRPPEDVYQMVQRRQRGYRNAMKQFYGERRAEDERLRGLEDGQTADTLLEGDEGDDRVCGSGRVPGVEEPDERGGELCETSERSDADGQSGRDQEPREEEDGGDFSR